MSIRKAHTIKKTEIISFFSGQRSRTFLLLFLLITVMQNEILANSEWIHINRAGFIPLITSPKKATEDRGERFGKMSLLAKMNYDASRSSGKLNDFAPPVFSSSNTAVIEEGTTIATTVLDVNANDGAGGAADANVTYALSGTDAAAFSVKVNTGKLSFQTSPDWSNPIDSDTDNIYELVVTANNGTVTATQNLQIFVFPKSSLTGTEVAQQLGAGIDGEAAGDQSGFSVSSSADGRTVAVGAIANDGNERNAGHVRIYGYTGTAWIQLGADIDGEAASDLSGYSVSLSADGKTVAIGAPGNDGNGSNSGHVRIYGYTGTAWVQLGADIDGEAAEDRSSASVSLSANGKMVAIGAIGNDGNGNGSGHVRVYGYNGAAWVQLGADIDGEAAGDLSGLSLSLSADGKTVAIWTPDNTGSDLGHVRIYKFNGAAWVQLGSKIDSEATGDQSGLSLSLSADGKTVAIGVTLNEGNGNFLGQARIYLYNGAAWVQVGANIDGEAVDGSRSGDSVSLSADGKTVAIGTVTNDGNGSNSGHVRIYRYNAATWVQVGSDIDGEAAGDESGYPVSLSADGKTVAISAYRKNDLSGHVRVYELVIPTPIFESSSSAVIEEGTTGTILDIDAIDEAGGAADANVTYILSGTDAAAFSVKINTGTLSFQTSPDWSNPTDSDTDNIYELVVTANNGTSTNTQNLQIFVFPTNGLTGSEIAQQLGADIDGEAAGDLSAASVSFSADGKTVAISARLNDDTDTDAGHVRIFEYNGVAWVQLGADIDGEAASDLSGISVSLSADGKTVAIGAPDNAGNGSESGHVRIYGYNGTTWVQLGVNINGEAAGDQSGYSVSLSADGKAVAIGAIGNDGNGNGSGHVRVYGYNGAAWVQLGADIDGEAADDLSGWSVSMSADGKTVAIGAIGNDSNGNGSGQVRIYGYNAAVWVQLGADIDGEAVGDDSGWYVNLSADGRTVAIGATFNNGNGNFSGQVRIYEYDGAAWVQVGADIDGEAAGDQSGFSVSLSADGRTVAIGATGNDGNGNGSGQVRIYLYNGAAWAQVGADIDGEAADDRSGGSVSLSADGRTVAIGATENTGNGNASGHVRVYELNSIPVVSNLTVSGTLAPTEQLTARYTYSDANSDIESGTTYQWYTSIDNQGTNRAVIAGATSSTYTLTNNELGKYISVLVTPKDGKTFGTAVESALVGTVKTDQAITFNALDDKTYGDASFELLATSNADLAISYASSNINVATVSGTTLSILGAGTATITAQQEGNANYTAATSVEQTFTVSKAAITITADAKTKTYGEANPALTITYEGFVNGDDESLITEPTVATTADASTGVGTVPITLSGGSATNYELTSNSGTLTIGLAALTATADDKAKLYGEENPALTITYDGFVNGDDESLITEPIAATTADATTGVGAVPVTLSGGSATNYELTSNSGTLTIGQAALTATADDKAKVYGEANPALTLTYAGFVNGDDESLITEPSAETTADATTGVGTVPITLSGGSATNYELTSNSGTLTIGQAALTATAEDKSFNKGEDLPVLDITFEGFVNGEDVSVLDTAPTASTTATATSDRGAYSIDLTAGSDNNYEIAIIAGTMTVTGPVYTLPTEVIFEALVLGDTGTETISLSNTGDGSLNVTGISVPAGYSINQTVFDVVNGSNTNLILTFTPTEVQAYSGSLVMSSNNGEDEIVVNGTGQIVTGIDDDRLDLEEVKLYPNPANDRLIIDLSDSPTQIADLKLVDLKGNEVWAKVGSRLRTEQVDVSRFTSGLYLVVVTTAKGTVIKKVMVKH